MDGVLVWLVVHELDGEPLGEIDCVSVCEIEGDNVCETVIVIVRD